MPVAADLAVSTDQGDAELAGLEHEETIGRIQGRQAHGRMGVKQDHAKASQSFSPTGSNGSSRRSIEPRSCSRAWALQWDVETCLGVADGAGEGESLAPAMTMILRLWHPEPSGGDGLNRLRRRQHLRP